MFQGRPVIVVTTLYDRARESYWMLPGYMEGLEEAGAIPLMPLLTQKPEVLNYFLDQCDGILLPPDGAALRSGGTYGASGGGLPPAAAAGDGGAGGEQPPPPGGPGAGPLYAADGLGGGRPGGGLLDAGQTVCLGGPVAPGARLPFQPGEPADFGGICGRCQRAITCKKTGGWPSP